MVRNITFFILLAIFGLSESAFGKKVDLDAPGIVTFDSLPNPKVVPKDDEKTNKKLERKIDRMELPEPNYINSFISWANFGEYALYCLAFEKNPGKVFYIITGVNIRERSPFYKEVFEVIKTKSGRENTWNWIKKPLKSIVSISDELKFKLEETLRKISAFNYKDEKSYYNKCKQNNRKADFVRINPKTQKYDWDRWIISWLYRRVENKTLSENIIKGWGNRIRKYLF